MKMDRKSICPEGDSMPYPGGKSGAGVYQRIINEIPPHDVYIEPFLGGAAVMRLKRPAGRSIGIDLDVDALAMHHDIVPGLELLRCDGIAWLRFAFGLDRLPGPGDPPTVDRPAADPTARSRGTGATQTAAPPARRSRLALAVAASLGDQLLEKPADHAPRYRVSESDAARARSPAAAPGGRPPRNGAARPIGPTSTPLYPASRSEPHDSASGSAGGRSSGGVLLPGEPAGRAFVYLDPPYPLESRRSQQPLYRFEMTTEQHVLLLQTAIALPCPVILSSYPNALYDEWLLDRPGWRKVTFKTRTRRGPATEVLWLNYPPPTELHDYRYVGRDKRERERIRRKVLTWVRGIRRLPGHEGGAILDALRD